MSATGFYHCSVKSVGRSNGRSIVAAAAYRAGEQLMDERTGQIADYRARGGVLDSFIVTPADAPAWTQARTWLWNGAEAAEHRANGRLATELELALPHELTAAQRKELLSDFVLKVVEKYGVAADVAIHAPGKEGDHRNIHAHVLITNRKLDENGFVEKAEGQRKDIGLSGFAMGSEAVTEIRQAWEQHVNLAYERAGLDIEVDHRSHKDRGIAQEPTIHMGPEATAMERRGIATELGDANREIMTSNAVLRAQAQLEIEVVKAEAELAAAKMLAEMERRDRQGADYAAAKGRRDEIFPDRSAEQTMQEAWTAAKGRVDDVRAPVFDRDAASRDADEKIIDAAIAADQEARAAARGRKDDIRGPQDMPTARGPYADLPQPDYASAKGRTDDIAPELGKTAGAIRMSWSLSNSASELQEGLAAHGISLALTSAEEAQQSQRAAAFAKEVGNFARVLREGEIVAVDGAGHVYRLDERNTGDSRPEIEGRLAGIDRAELLNIADTKEVMREASRAAWVEQQRIAQEQARPASWIESRIAEIANQARIGGADAYIDSEGKLAGRADVLADRFKPADEQQIHALRVYGGTAFETRLDAAEIAIARVTEADIKALAALRQDESMARVAAETNIESHKPHHFAADLVAGDIAAVTRDGDVYRINPDKTGDAKQHLAGDLPSVVEARAYLEQEREQISALWDSRRAEAATTRQDFAAAREFDQQAAQAMQEARAADREIGEAVHTGERASSGLSGSVARAVENFLGSLFDTIFPPPPPTRDQAERAERVAEERHTEQTTAADRAQMQADYDRLAEAQRTKDIASFLQVDPVAPTSAELYGTPKPRTQEQREKEQERDYGREL